MRVALPTRSFRIREDSWGDGDFMAPRGNRFHHGIDLVVEPGEPIASMIDGKIDRVVYPYASDLEWTGLQLSNEYVKVYYFYCTAISELIGKRVNAGHVIALADDISQKYQDDNRSPMTPHLHVQVWIKPFNLLNSSGVPNSTDILIDPRVLIGE